MAGGWLGKRAAVLAALGILAAVVPAVESSAEPPMCRPGGGGDGGGCIPSPIDCASGRFNGEWASSRDGRRASCDGYVDEAGRWHVRRYVGGDPSLGCVTTIREDRLIEGSWTDPNQACGAYDVTPGYGAAGSRYRGAVTSRYGAVASASPDASAVGIEILASGGNAMDAAVAAVFAVGVVAQESCGIGGGGFLLYRGADGRTAALDFREMAPAALPPNFEAAPRRYRGSGHQVVGVPGTVAGMAAATERFGTRRFDELLRPAIRLAERGVRLTPFQIDVLAAERERLATYEEAQRLYLDDEAVPAPYPVGRERPQQDLARTLRTLARQGPEAFYRGPIARAIIAEMARSRRADLPAGERGVMTAEDLAAYRAVWRQPLRGRYRGRTVLAVPPPTAGGFMVLETLNLLERFPLGRTEEFRHSSAGHLHVMAEAKKIVAADRDAYGGDPDFVDVPTDELTSKDYADRRRDDIDLTKAKQPAAGEFPGYTPRPPGRQKAQGTSTHHISVVDAAGNAAAVTCTVEQRFGSAVVVPGTGVLLNNEMTDFDDPGSANEVRPGKRPRSSISPVIVVDGDRPALVLGAPGGPRIPMGVATVISNVLDFRMSPALAVDVARIDADKCCTVELEQVRIPAAERDALAARGHTVIDRKQYHPQFGPLVEVTGIRRDGRRFAVSDPRYQTAAAGY
ncbi:MAG TPA: gamma-glutamyltransferase [Acidimicrobiia bacterium]|nr:gamma-glutamyltransferase [Acidimicrobiia bacterium]